MRAFVNVDYLANRMVTHLGYDGDEIARALIGYANEISTYGEGRARYHDRIQKLLRIPAES